MAKSPQTAPNPQQQNNYARAAVLAQSLNMWQQIFQNTYASAIPGRVINIPFQNVGLIKRFLVKIEATIARSAAETQTKTTFGPANLLSQVVLTDLNNNTRINTTGWHLHMLATARRQGAYGAAFVNNSPISIGANYNVIVSPPQFTAGNQSIVMYYEIPIAYSDMDLRGAIYANVVNATGNLQITVNNNFFVGSGADATLAGYQSSTAGDLGTFSSLKVTVYQNYLDQIPMTNKGPLLPYQDLGQVYLLNNTVVTGLSQNQDIPIPYANFRQFLSTFLIYDNAGALNAGTDIAYFALQTANYTNIFKVDPITQALFARQIIGDDFPAGMYYFDSRNKPISTIQYGNQQLVVNASNVAGATSQFLMGYEMIALQNQITGAGSLFAS